MPIWPPARDAIERPAYRSLAQTVAAAIEAGELAPGARLPTHRDLAWRLGLSVQTVSRAYEELARAGRVSGEVGRGTFVRGTRSESPPPYQRLAEDASLVDCSILTPVTGAPHEVALRAALADIGAGVLPAGMMSFRPQEAFGVHVEAALGWLERCGLHPTREQVIPTAGATAAITAALLTAAGPGDVIATEALGHHTLPGLTRALGLRLIGLPTDAEGVQPEALAAACQTGRVRVLFAMPAGIGAAACTAGRERRQAICAVARRYDVALIENDAWGPLEPSRPPPLAALAPERTFYATGLGKCLLPGLRLGWLVAPPAAADAARARHRETNWMAPTLLAEIATRWLGDGTAGRLLRWQRRMLAQRQQVARAALAGLSWRSADHGLHLWLPVPPGCAEAALVADLHAAGVAVAPGAAFATVGRDRPHGVRVSVGGPSEPHLAAAMARVAECWRAAASSRA